MAPQRRTARILLMALLMATLAGTTSCVTYTYGPTPRGVVAKRSAESGLRGKVHYNLTLKSSTGKRHSFEVDAGTYKVCTVGSSYPKCISRAYVNRAR